MARVLRITVEDERGNAFPERKRHSTALLAVLPNLLVHVKRTLSRDEFRTSIYSTSIESTDYRLVDCARKRKCLYGTSSSSRFNGRKIMLQRGLSLRMK